MAVRVEPELLTLLIAWQLARVDGMNEAAAIRRTARKLRQTTKDKNVLSSLKSMLKCTSDALVVESLKTVLWRMEADGLFNKRI